MRISQILDPFRQVSDPAQPPEIGRSLRGGRSPPRDVDSPACAAPPPRRTNYSCRLSGQSLYHVKQFAFAKRSDALKTAFDVIPIKQFHEFRPRFIRKIAAFYASCDHTPFPTKYTGIF